jgi:K+-sensing histidine kinase KdpD
MAGENLATNVNLHRLERGTTWTWILGGLLILALTAGLLFFYFASQAEATGQAFSLRNITPPQMIMTGGLVGLVMLFGLYGFRKHKSITHMRNELIQRSMQEESLRSRLSELSVLFDVSGEANLQLELEPLLELITRRVLTCLESDRSSIFLIDDTSGELVCRCVSGAQTEAVREKRIKPGVGIAGWVAENNEPLVLNDDDTVRKFASEVKPGRGISTALCVPMATAGNVIGVLNLSRIEGTEPFTAADARMVTIFAEHAASAIVRIRQYAALDQKAELLHQANQTLARLNRSKQVFLATVNHELKAPLTIILAYAEFLARNEAALDVSRRQSFATILYEQAKRLQGITGQIHNISRLEDMDVKLDLAPTSINATVREVVEELQEEAEGKAVTLRMHLDASAPKLKLDSHLFGQAIRMLLSNAISTAESHTEIAVSSHTDSEYFSFEVRGKGIKISPKETERVFNLFDGTEPPAESLIDGLGLGLYLLRRVTELHQGRVRAKNLDEGGCGFTAVLPIGQNGDEESPAVDEIQTVWVSTEDCEETAELETDAA